MNSETTEICDDVGLSKDVGSTSETNSLTSLPSNERIPEPAPFDQASEEISEEDRLWLRDWFGKTPIARPSEPPEDSVSVVGTPTPATSPVDQTLKDDLVAESLTFDEGLSDDALLDPSSTTSDASNEDDSNDPTQFVEGLLNGSATPCLQTPPRLAVKAVGAPSPAPSLVDHTLNDDSFENDAIELELLTSFFDDQELLNDFASDVKKSLQPSAGQVNKTCSSHDETSVVGKAVTNERFTSEISSVHEVAPNSATSSTQLSPPKAGNPDETTLGRVVTPTGSFWSEDGRNPSSDKKLASAGGVTWRLEPKRLDNATAKAISENSFPFKGDSKKFRVKRKNRQKNPAERRRRKSSLQLPTDAPEHCGNVPPLDVFLGRGPGYYNAHGDVIWRAEVKLSQPEYLAATKMEKRPIAEAVVHRMIHKHNASFWEDGRIASMDRVREATSQKLRETLSKEDRKRKREKYSLDRSSNKRGKVEKKATKKTQA